MIDGYFKMRLVFNLLLKIIFVMNRFSIIKICLLTIRLSIDIVIILDR